MSVGGIVVVVLVVGFFGYQVAALARDIASKRRAKRELEESQDNEKSKT